MLNTNETGIKSTHWVICLHCQGRGKKSKRIRKKAKLHYQRELLNFERQGQQGLAPVKPKGHLATCKDCNGAGIVSSYKQAVPDKVNYPNVAIIGAGIGGVALAVACLHRGIPFTLYERDKDFDTRSQGYGLTLQQANRVMSGLGLASLEDGIVSTRHVVHNIEGKEIAEWGNRKWVGEKQNTVQKTKPTNTHIARQSLRLALLKQLENLESSDHSIKWNHQLINFQKHDSIDDNGINLTFKVNGEVKQSKADLIVGADGIRSTVRRLVIGEEVSPLSYLGCIVILGICPLQALENIESPLLDSATVFQTANGHERIYVMPYDSTSIMWQLSFPMLENDAKILSEKGTQALKNEALLRCQWHSPIPDIISSTEIDKISGYPVYDRELLDQDLLTKDNNKGIKQVTVIGDAAHPMSPFKGQGANQAILDALSLAKLITKECRPSSNWKEIGIRNKVLNEFEKEMITRSAVKVKGSAEAAKFLHSDIALHEANEPRGRCLLKS